MSNLKDEFEEELSALLREFEERGLEPEEMGDSLSWQSDLARSRERCQDSEKMKA